MLNKSLFGKWTDGPMQPVLKLHRTLLQAENG